MVRPIPFKQEKGWAGSKKELGHPTVSAEHESAFATHGASSKSSKNQLIAHTVMKDSTCEFEKKDEEDLTYQVILQLLRR